MRTPLLSAAVVALLGSAGAIANDSMSLNQFPHRFEPVLVRVDAHGKVTEASPAYELPPKLTRLLNANLDEIIRAPATDKDGKPIPSQFVMNMALQAKPNSTGNYDAHFAFVSTKPVPPGNWYWVHLTGDRLALASQDMRFDNRRSYLPVQHDGDGYYPTYKGNSQPVPATVPAMHNAPSNTAIPAPPPSHTR